VGGDPVGVAIASPLKDAGVTAIIVDSDPRKVSDPVHKGLEALGMDALSEDLPQDLQLERLGRLLAVTPNDEVNPVASFHFREAFGNAEVYQLPPSYGIVKGGRILFGEHATHEHLSSLLKSGARVVAAVAGESSTGSLPASRIVRNGIPMFVLHKPGGFSLFTADSRPDVKPGDTFVRLVAPLFPAVSGTVNGFLLFPHASTIVHCLVKS
jgi:hypothetical protein